jgi:Ctr copper transporter family
MHMVLVYWLMLLTMTYEAVLFTAVILGLMIGHCVFDVVLAESPPCGSVNSSGAEYMPLLGDRMHMSADELVAAAGSPCCSQGDLALPK